MQTNKSKSDRTGSRQASRRVANEKPHDNTVAEKLALTQQQNEDLRRSTDKNRSINQPKDDGPVNLVKFNRDQQIKINQLLAKQGMPGGSHSPQGEGRPATPKTPGKHPKGHGNQTDNGPQSHRQARKKEEYQNRGKGGSREKSSDKDPSGEVKKQNRKETKRERLERSGNEMIERNNSDPFGYGSVNDSNEGAATADSFVQGSREKGKAKLFNTSDSDSDERSSTESDDDFFTADEQDSVAVNKLVDAPIDDVDNDERHSTTPIQPSTDIQNKLLNSQITNLELNIKLLERTKEHDLKIKFQNDRQVPEASKNISLPYSGELPKIYSPLQIIIKYALRFISILSASQILRKFINTGKGSVFSVLLSVVPFLASYLIRPRYQLPILQLKLLDSERQVADGRGDNHKHHSAKHENTVNTYSVKYPHICPKFRNTVREMISDFKSNSHFDVKTGALFKMKDLILQTELDPCDCKCVTGEIAILQEHVDQVMSTLVRRGDPTTVRAFIDSGVTSYPFAVYNRAQNACSYLLLNTSNFLLMNYQRYECVKAGQHGNSVDYSKNFPLWWTSSLLHL